MLLAFSCASRDEGWKSTADDIKMDEKEYSEMLNSAMSSWSKRSDKSELIEALNVFEKLARVNHPKRIEVFTYLTRGYYLLADIHFENMNDKRTYWEKGTSFGEKAFVLDAAFAKAVENDSNYDDYLNLLGKDYVGAIYWTAANLGKWAKSHGIVTQLKFKSRIKKLIERVDQLDPEYFYMASTRYWGAYYAVAPSFAGGDLDKSLVKFKKAMSEAPEYLGTKVLYAMYYLTKKGDQKAFVKALNEVIAYDVSKAPAIQPENLAEKEKAKKLLQSKKDLF